MERWCRDRLLQRYIPPSRPVTFAGRKEVSYIVQHQWQRYEMRGIVMGQQNMGCLHRGSEGLIAHLLLSVIIPRGICGLLRGVKGTCVMSSTLFVPGDKQACPVFEGRWLRAG
jgi:hypothetical protein